MENFEQFIEAVKTQMQPEPRAKATAATLEQLVRLVPDGTTLADLADGWETLSMLQCACEDASIIARRMTCDGLYEIARRFIGNPSSVSAVAVWQAWANAFDPKSSDPRHANMGKTFARELAELKRL